MKDLSPSSWIDDYTSDGEDILIPISSLRGLTAEDANQATGDIRRVLFALCETIYDVMETLEDSEKPELMVFQKAVRPAKSVRQLWNNFDIRFRADIPNMTVGDEEGEES